MIEIQTFFLAREVRPVFRMGTMETGFDAQDLAMTTFWPVQAFPFDIVVPFFLSLRRAQLEGAETGTLHLHLIDADGQPAGEPAHFEQEIAFPEGQRFHNLPGKVVLAFPTPGPYRLEVAVHSPQTDTRSHLAYELSAIDPHSP